MQGTVVQATPGRRSTLWMRKADMQVLLDKPPGKQVASMDVGQIRRLILSVFPDAIVLHRWQLTDSVEQITVDDCFAMLRKDSGRKWLLASVHEVHGNFAIHQLGEFSSAQNAVRRLVVLMATARVEAGIGKAAAR